LAVERVQENEAPERKLALHGCSVVLGAAIVHHHHLRDSPARLLLQLPPHPFSFASSFSSPFSPCKAGEGSDEGSGSAQK
jgi:hypothetical protein